MSTINQLSVISTISAGDLVPIFVQSQGDTYAGAMTTLAAFIQTLITSTDNKVTQYAAPSATAFNVVINGSGLPAYNSSVWLVLTPTGTLAAGTITLPPVATAADKQEVLVNSTQAVTALTIAGNGATVTGAPTTLAANSFFKLRFEGVTDTWYRVG